jgi:hypothetical protein
MISCALSFVYKTVFLAVKMMVEFLTKNVQIALEWPRGLKMSLDSNGGFDQNGPNAMFDRSIGRCLIFGFLT